MTDRSLVPSRSPRTAWLVTIPGLLHAASSFTPAARLRLWGTIPFFQLHWLGAVTLALGFGVALAAWFRQPRWMIAGSVSSLLIVTAMHIRIVRAPLGNFGDHLMRHAIHPAWGFVPMYASLILELIAATWLLASTKPVPLPVEVGGDVAIG